MGWTFRRGASKETIIHDILEPWDTTATEETAKSWYGAKPAGTRTQSIVLAYRCVGNSLWYVRETTTTKPDGTVTINDGLALQDVHCNACGIDWTDRYLLNGICETEAS